MKKVTFSKVLDLQHAILSKTTSVIGAFQVSAGIWGKLKEITWGFCY